MVLTECAVDLAESAPNA